MEKANRRENIVEEKKVASTKEGGIKGRGVDDLKELDAAINTFTQFPELRTES